MKENQTKTTLSSNHYCNVKFLTPTIYHSVCVLTTSSTYLLPPQAACALSLLLPFHRERASEGNFRLKFPFQRIPTVSETKPETINNTYPPTPLQKYSSAAILIHSGYNHHAHWALGPPGSIKAVQKSWISTVLCLCLCGAPTAGAWKGCHQKDCRPRLEPMKCWPQLKPICFMQRFNQ